MIPRSIRRRLPLSYGAIALLVALALGGILLIVLRGYYAGRERDHLLNNGYAISNTLQPLLADPNTAPEELQAQVESLAFLSQTRVRVLDADRRVLADSGPFNPFRIRLALGPWVAGSDRTTGILQGRDRLPAATGGPPAEIAIIVPRVDPDPTRSPRVLGGELSVIGTLQGFDLSAGIDAGAERSDQQVEVALYPEPDQLGAIIVLSEGPAYGSEIVGQVAWGWAIAAAIAVALATGAGWLISRQINAPLLTLTAATERMASGDLGARADVTARDEFGSLARSFNQMAEQVESTVVTLRRFVSDAAHELKTPLTALQTNLELAPDDEFVRQAQGQVERLARLTEGLLDLARVQAGGDRAKRAPVDLVALVRGVSEIYASRADQAGLAFDLALPAGPVTVEAARTQVVQVLENLLDNAIKFTPEGGSVEVGVRPHDGGATVWVRDTGVGIPPEDVPRLFDRFHRGGNAAGIPGSGLGLAIARATVEAHGGHIEAESSVGEGTWLSFTLPLIP
jgi:signal transduction histidine kinase